MPPKKSRTPAVLLVGHGSRKRGFDAPMRRVARRLRARGQWGVVRLAFLEIATPGVAEALHALVDEGHRRILVVPYFLQAGRHVTEDLPELVASARRSVRGAKAVITLCPYLGYHDKITEVVEARLREGL